MPEPARAATAFPRPPTKTSRLRRLHRAIEGIQHPLSTGSAPFYRVHPAANARSFPLTVTRPRPPPWVHYGRRIEPVDSAR